MVWDTATHAPIARFSRMYYVSEYTGTTRGKPLAGLAFSDNGALLVIGYEDGTEDHERLPAVPS